MAGRLWDGSKRERQSTEEHLSGCCVHCEGLDRQLLRAEEPFSIGQGASFCWEQPPSAPTQNWIGLRTRSGAAYAPTRRSVRVSRLRALDSGSRLSANCVNFSVATWMPAAHARHHLAVGQHRKHGADSAVSCSEDGSCSACPAPRTSRGSPAQLSSPACPPEAGCDAPPTCQCAGTRLPPGRPGSEWGNQTLSPTPSIFFFVSSFGVQYLVSSRIFPFSSIHLLSEMSPPTFSCLISLNLVLFSAWWREFL